MDMPYLFIYSAVDAHLDCFEFLATLNKYAMNKYSYISLYMDICFHSFWVKWLAGE